MKNQNDLKEEAIKTKVEEEARREWGERKKKGEGGRNPKQNCTLFQEDLCRFGDDFGEMSLNAVFEHNSNWEK